MNRHQRIIWDQPRWSGLYIIQTQSFWFDKNFTPIDVKANLLQGITSIS
jgi:hypothetical protein